MSNQNGYNPMRYNCEKNGCFNAKRRPKIEMFAKCFPNRINFGDVDGEVELHGYGLKLEWKSYVGELPKGQSIMFKKKTAYGIDSVLCVVGNAETMEVTHIGAYKNGEWSGWRKGNIDSVFKNIESWVKSVNSIPPADTIAGIMECLYKKFGHSDILRYMAMKLDEERLKEKKIEPGNVKKIIPSQQLTKKIDRNKKDNVLEVYDLDKELDEWTASYARELELASNR